MNTTETNTPAFAMDLTKQAPRSPRIRLGGYAVLPRLLDKCRADIAGTIGEYHTNCALDKEFLEFTGIDYDELREQLAKGMPDGEVLTWIQDNATKRARPWEIETWTRYQDRRSPAPQTGLADYYASALASLSKTRSDIRTWAELLDLDDYCSFGGAA